MTEHITLLYQGREFRLPLVTGWEKEKAIDISRLSPFPAPRSRLYAAGREQQHRLKQGFF